MARRCDYCRDKAQSPGLVTCRPDALALGSGSGRGKRLGTQAAQHPRGLTSNRHAGRPDRWSIRAFAFLETPSSDDLLHPRFGLLGRSTDLALSKGYAAMARNVGPEDRVVRIVVGLGLGLLAYLQVLPPIPSIIMAVLAVYFVLSGLFARCLLYKMADIDTSVQEQPYSTTDDRSGL